MKNPSTLIVNKGTQPDKQFADRTCVSDKCFEEVPEGIATMMCVNHLRKAWAAYELIKGTELDKFRSKPTPRLTPHHHGASGSVYFAQVGRYVKIGWSSNVENRMRALKATTLYVTVPGTRADEKAYHKTFKKYLAKDAEYFYPAPVLMDHIKRLQSGEAV